MLFLSSVGESTFQLVVVLFIFVGVLAVTYYVTKWIAGYQKSQYINNNLEVIETVRLTTNKYLQIVRAGQDKYFVIAIGKDEITKLGELTADDLKEIDTSAPEFVDFKAILEKVTKKK